MSPSGEMWRRVSMSAVGGGLGFWVANFAISLTPVAAEYRAALAIAYVPMLLEALIGGLTMGFCVSYVVIRFYRRIPGRSPILKSTAVSSLALIAVTVLIEVPAKFLTAAHGALRYFVIGTAFNGLRILALGVVIGYLYDRLARPSSPSRAGGRCGDELVGDPMFDVGGAGRRQSEDDVPDAGVDRR